MVRASLALVFAFLSTTAFAGDFEGIVSLPGCSGSLIDVGRPAEGKAVVMTNGHCARSPMLGPKEVLVDRPLRNFGTVGVGTRGGRHEAHATRIIYATMHETDLALFELDATYGELRAEGATAFRLAHEDAAPGTPVKIVSGYWNRRQDCEILGRVPTLKEDQYVWRDSFSLTSACNPPHGSSGSPVLSTTSDTVLAVYNTGSDDGEDCTFDNPCEIDGSGHHFAEKNRNYAQRITDLPGCFDAGGRFSLGLNTCRLPKP